MNKLKFQNKFFASILSFLLMLSVLPFVSAANLSSSDVTLYVPQLVRNSVLNGTVQINISIADAFADQNWTRAFAYIQSAGATANTTLFALNDSPDNRNQSRNNNSLILVTTPVEDGADYTLTIVLWNGSLTTSRVNATATVQINNSVPNTPTLLTPASITSQVKTATSNDVVFSGNVNGSATTACTLLFIGTNYNGASQSMTHSGSNCSLSLSNVPNGNYVWTIRASDGNDLATSSQFTTKVDVRSGTVAGIIASEETGKLGGIRNIGQRFKEVPRGLLNAVQKVPQSVGNAFSRLSELIRGWVNK